MQYFTFNTSTPDGKVSKILEDIFFTCSESESFPILSNSGIRDTKDIRQPNASFSSFMKVMPVRIPAAPGDPPSLIDILPERYTVRTYTFEDVVSELRGRTLQDDEMVGLLRWWVDVYETVTNHGKTLSELKEATKSYSGTPKREISLVNIFKFVDSNIMYPWLRPDDALPPDTIPLSFTRTLAQGKITPALSWKPMTAVDWLTYLISPQVDSAHDIRKNAKYSNRVVSILADIWYILSDELKSEAQELMEDVAWIATNQGLQRGSEAYFEEADVFRDLPVITADLFDPRVEIVLAEFGVRKQLDLAELFAKKQLDSDATRPQHADGLPLGFFDDSPHPYARPYYLMPSGRRALLPFTAHLHHFVDISAHGRALLGRVSSLSRHTYDSLHDTLPRPRRPNWPRIPFSGMPRRRHVEQIEPQENRPAVVDVSYAHANFRHYSKRELLIKKEKEKAKEAKKKAEDAKVASEGRSQPHQSSVVQQPGGVAQARPPSELHAAGVPSSSATPTQSSVTQQSGMVAQAQPTSQPNVTGVSTSPTSPAIATASAATTSMNLRPDVVITQVGCWIRFWLLIGCVSAQYTDSPH
ncbi:hypothetical protein M405DRAFT_807580 [Rhizopogon salebrosus TDB-379]|nr:hypothetical protein M405DRAFT_807580 [Rhizopogon salebrosus TDB-379]